MQDKRCAGRKDEVRGMQEGRMQQEVCRKEGCRKRYAGRNDAVRGVQEGMMQEGRMQ